MAAITARRYVDGLALVVRAAELQGSLRLVADLDTVHVRERVVWARIGGEPVRLRVYAPTGPHRQTVLLVSGLDPAGIDEPRLMTLARRLAESAVTVVTPDIVQLSSFMVTATVTDRIERTASWLATDSGLAPTGRIGLMGISFSGGLAVVAAGRPSLRDHLLYVFSLGGHDDLRRVLEYFCSAATDGTARSGMRLPHDYGVAIVLLAVAERLVPSPQLAPFSDAVRRFLRASYLDRIDKPQADREFAALRALAPRLPPPSGTLLRYVNNRDVVHLGSLLRPYINSYGDAPGLSPSRSPAPVAPVYLLHGRDDNVIPSIESVHLADRLHDVVAVRLLLTDLISHADRDQPAGVIDVMRLAAFWGDLLAR